MNRFSRDANIASVTAAPTNANPFGGRRGVFPDASTGQSEFAPGSPEEARRLLDEVQQLGTRMRVNRRKAQQIDRRAAAYASRLARHTARLMLHMPNAIPAVRPVPGTGASALRHYVLKHDRLDAPDRTRLLVVSSDGRLRICTVLTDVRHTRLWSDYEVANPPSGLGLSVVFEGLSSMIVRLESAAERAEAVSDSSANALDGLIAQSEARLANAGSLLSPMDYTDIADDDLYEQDDLYEPREEPTLRSHGFEERLPFTAPKAATTLNTPGRFAR